MVDVVAPAAPQLLLSPLQQDRSVEKKNEVKSRVGVKSGTEI